MKRLPQKWATLLFVGTITMFGSAQADTGWVGPKLAGAWEVVGTPEPSECGPNEPFLNVATISVDGSITNVDPAVGTGVGDGYRIGGGRYVIGFFGFLSPAPGLLLRYEVQGTIELLNPATFSGRFRSFITDPNGLIPDCVYEGTVAGTRLVPMPY